MLGVSAARGRAIQPADDHGAARVVMLGDALWRRSFASDPRVVGTVVTISSQRYEVIGVAPPTFTGPRGWLASTQFWIPLGTQSDGARQSRRLTIFGRLASTVTIAAASSEVRTIAARLDQSFPPRTGNIPQATDRPWRAKTMAEIADEDTAVRRFGMTLVALVGLGAGGRLHEPRQPRARSRDDTAARDRGAPRARRVEVAAGAGAVPRERDSRGGRGDRVLRRVRAAARRDRHRNQPRDAVRRTDDAVVSSGAERDGDGRRRVVTPRGAGRSLASSRRSS